MARSHPHPGKYIRKHVIPKKISLTKAADILGVGRPALSNLLNGKATLSREMAKRLELAFGCDVATLMEIQSDYESEKQSSGTRNLRKATKFVPPFLIVRANDIQSWAETHDSRHQLAVLIRKLVHSTCEDVEVVNFPGHDDSQRRGFDGLVRTKVGNSWVPSGESCWEFGTSKNVQKKANDDYSVRTNQATRQERSRSAFVFVSPRRWEGKESWLRERRAERKWADVIVWDANDLEQWMEQSIATQAWFDVNWGKNYAGVSSLERCWDEWCADCKPQLTKDLFKEPYSSFGHELGQHLLSKNTETLRITADSQQEALAFLATSLLNYDANLRRIADRVVVFRQPGYLTMLAVGSPGFIPVIANPDVERELGELGFKLKAVVVENQGHRSSQQTICLRPLSDQGFSSALETMGLGPDEISLLYRESGRSLTVLRRRLARNERLKHPDWAEKQEVASSLAAMALTGAWSVNNSADVSVLQELAQCDTRMFDRAFGTLLNVDESPVWAVGEYRGVVSKLDILYAISRWLPANLLQKFLNVARTVLSVRSPALDLPEDQRWASVLYGKVPAFSDQILKGISESLVLLAIHGKHLFGDLIREPGQEIANVINRLLVPMTVDQLISQCKHLPRYAEAAPEAFLHAFEKDLEREEPAVATLMERADNMWFSQNYRVHLLWALELLAWHPKWLVRVVNLLAQLAEQEPDDNLSNKPSNSLLSIFRSWMPQTGASLDERIEALDYLTREYPKVTWHILLEQLAFGQQIGGYSPKPLWRDYAIGFGEPVGVSDRDKFVRYCIQTSIEWVEHSVDTLSDLIRKTEKLDSTELTRLEEVINTWANHSWDKERSILQEHVRGEIGSLKLRVGSGKIGREHADKCIAILKRAYEQLNPIELVWRHAWLFKQRWVERSYEEKEEEELSEEAHEEQVRQMRIKALIEIRSELGDDGVIQLAFCGDAPQVAGFIFVDAEKELRAQISLLKRVLSQSNQLQSEQHIQLVKGIFSGMGPERAVSVVEIIKQEWNIEVVEMLLRLIPFHRRVWTELASFGETITKEYWHKVIPLRGQFNSEDINYVVSQLLAVGRPYTAFEFAHLEWKRLESTHIQSILLDLAKDNVRSPQLMSRNDAHYIERALLIMDERRALPQSELAQLELSQLALCPYGNFGIPNLEREIASKPELFGDFVALTRRRLTGDEKRTDNEYRAIQIAFRLLNKLKRLPGQDKDGVLKAELLKNWIQKVQTRCDSLNCRDSADYRIGELLSNAPQDNDDGIWPCLPVRVALESHLNTHMEEGFLIGRRNARGVQLRGQGGDQERLLAEEYDDGAQGCASRHPSVAATLGKLATSLRSDGLIWDEDAAVRERLGD